MGLWDLKLAQTNGMKNGVMIDIDTRADVGAGLSIISLRLRLVVIQFLSFIGFPPCSELSAP